ncbi:MAG: type II toxin-antitoxin system VapC family toxin [Treponema sp.]|jgi:predicted nucleic acid-binding protein|nr:type II toxin-antitoxin system VapC family toxin [Treponema sp.]
MTYVFDSSFVAALIIPDENSQKIDKFLSDIKETEDIFVPQLLWYEIANIFKNLLRRKRYTYDELLNFFPKLTAIRLTTDSIPGSAYTEKLLRLSNDYDLSAYDAAYLELAGRKKALLATLDEDLHEAAAKSGIKLLK